MSDRLSEPILIEELEENLADDPYGTAMFAMRNILTRAIANKGTMSEAEYHNLLRIQEEVAA